MAKEVGRVNVHQNQDWAEVKDAVEAGIAEATSRGYVAVTAEFDAERGTVYSSWSEDTDKYYVVIYGHKPCPAVDAMLGRLPEGHTPPLEED